MEYEIKIKRITPAPEYGRIQSLIKGGCPDVETIYVQRVADLNVKSVIAAVNDGTVPDAKQIYVQNRLDTAR